MTSTSQMCALLYCDLVGSSNIINSDISVLFQKHLSRLSEEARNYYNALYVNNTGDGFAAVFPTAYDCAQLALRVRDTIVQVDLRREYDIDPFQIRVGLDLQQVELIHGQGDIVHVTGSGMNKAARIEPVVDANHVWCTKRFYDQLIASGANNINGKVIGLRDLAKGSGTETMYDLSWAPLLGIEKPSNTETEDQDDSSLEIDNTYDRVPSLNSVREVGTISSVQSVHTRVIDVIDRLVKTGEDVYIRNIALTLEATWPSLLADMIQRKEQWNNVTYHGLVINPESRRIQKICDGSTISTENARNSIQYINSAINKFRNYLSKRNVQVEIRVYNDLPVIHGFLISNRFVYISLTDFREGKLGWSNVGYYYYEGDPQNEFEIQLSKSFNDWFDFFWKSEN